jgi:hypothetical protein
MFSYASHCSYIFEIHFKTFFSEIILILLYNTHCSLEAKISEHPELFTSCSSIRETLGLFLYRHHLLDAPSTVLENDVQLVEAAFGRIKLFGGTARTVLDEPLALKATIDYFHEKDPQLVAAAERAMLHSDNPRYMGPCGKR